MEQLVLGPVWAPFGDFLCQCGAHTGSVRATEQRTFPCKGNLVWVGQDLSAMGTTAQQVRAQGSQSTSLSQPQVPEAPERAQVTNRGSVGDQPVAPRCHWEQVGKAVRKHRDYSPS